MLHDVSNGDDNWLHKVKRMLESAGFAEIWMQCDSVIGNKFIHVIRQRRMDVYIVMEGVDECQ